LTELHEFSDQFVKFAQFVASFPPMTDIAIRVDNLSKL